MRIASMRGRGGSALMRCGTSPVCTQRQNFFSGSACERIRCPVSYRADHAIGWSDKAGRLGPSDAFEVNSNVVPPGPCVTSSGSALGTTKERADPVARVRREEERVQPAEVIRYREMKLHFSGII